VVQDAQDERMLVREDMRVDSEESSRWILRNRSVAHERRRVCHQEVSECRGYGESA